MTDSGEQVFRTHMPKVALVSGDTLVLAPAAAIVAAKKGTRAWHISKPGSAATTGQISQKLTGSLLTTSPATFLHLMNLRVRPWSGKELMNPGYRYPGMGPTEQTGGYRTPGCEISLLR